MSKQTNGAPTERDVQREVLPKQSDGPWSLKEVPGADGHLSVVDSKGLFVARVHWRGEVVTAEARANARIIAAAPDLRDAVEAAIDEFAIGSFNAQRRQRVVEFLRRAVAEGGGPVMSALPVPSSPVVAARDGLVLKLRDEDGTGETVRVVDLTLSSSHPHDTHAAGEYLVELGDFPARVAALMANALRLHIVDPMKALDAMHALRREAEALAERGELVALARVKGGTR